MVLDQNSAALFVMYAKLVDADCAKDIYQRGRAVDGAKSGGWRDPVVLHPQQFHRLRPWGGHHVSCVLALCPAAVIRSLAMLFSL